MKKQERTKSKLKVKRREIENKSYTIFFAYIAVSVTCNRNVTHTFPPFAFDPPYSRGKLNKRGLQDKHFSRCLHRCWHVQCKHGVVRFFCNLNPVLMWQTESSEPIRTNFLHFSTLSSSDTVLERTYIRRSGERKRETDRQTTTVNCHKTDIEVAFVKCVSASTGVSWIITS